MVKRVLRDRRGVTALEFAFTMPIFLTIILLAMEAAWQLAIGAGLDHGTRLAARWAATGQAAPAGSTRVLEVQRLVRESSGLPIRPDRLTVTPESFTAIGGLTAGAATPGIGGPDQLTRYRIEYLSEPLTPLGAGLLTAGMFRHAFSVVVRNEPYVPPS